MLILHYPTRDHHSRLGLYSRKLQSLQTPKRTERGKIPAHASDSPLTLHLVTREG